MIFFKSGKIALKKAIAYMDLGESSKKYGYIMLHKKRVFVGRDFKNLKGLQEHFFSLGLNKKELNESQIVFCHTNEKDKMPLPICNKPHLRVKEIMQYDNIVMVEHLNLYLPNQKFSKEVEYILGVLNSFKEEVLQNSIQFLNRFGLFEGNCFVICNKHTGFKFFGEFRDKNGGVSNGDIRNHKYMVYSNIF